MPTPSHSPEETFPWIVAVAAALFLLVLLDAAAIIGFRAANEQLAATPVADVPTASR